MFYCDKCADSPRLTIKWPKTMFKSHGPCEICGTVTNCNDMPSKYLPVQPKKSDSPPEG